MLILKKSLEKLKHLLKFSFYFNVKRFYLLLCFIYFFYDCKSQENDTLRYFVGFNSTGTYNKTNSNSSYLFSNNIDLSAQSKTLKVNFSNKWLYGQQQDKLVNNDFSSSFNLNWYRRSRDFYYWTLINYNKNYSLKINSQLQCGGGIAYNIFKGKNYRLNVSEGLLYDYTDIDKNDSVRDVYQTPRNSFRIKFRWVLGKRFNFSTVGYIQNSLQRRDDYILNTETNFSIQIIEYLSLNTKCTYNKINRNAKENLFMTYGLIFARSF